MVAIPGLLELVRVRELDSEIEKYGTAQDIANSSPQQ